MRSLRRADGHGCSTRRRVAAGEGSAALL